MQQWYLARGTARVGPLTAEQLQKEPGLNRDSLVWAEGLRSWAPLGDVPELADVALGLPPRAYSPAPAKQERALHLQPRVRADPRLATRLRTWLVLYLASIVLSALALALSGPHMGDIAAVLGTAAVCVWVASFVVQLVHLHSLWTLIQGLGARVTPGKAIGLLFVPIYGIYWILVCYHGLAVDLGAALARQGKPDERPSPSLASVVCAFKLILCVPYVGILVAFLPLMVLVPLYMRQVTRAGIALHHDGGLVA